uniref:Uncharacterized protein n=1 Tax=Octactis speculum TaxID=3111310 RepID=A0A7S2F3B5_9STRA
MWTFAHLLLLSCVLDACTSFQPAPSTLVRLGARFWPSQLPAGTAPTDSLSFLENGFLPSAEEAKDLMKCVDLESSGTTPPLGILIAGFQDDHLETVAMALDQAIATADFMPKYIPLVPLTPTDFGTRLCDFLTPEVLAARDSVIPRIHAWPRVPLFLLSGFSADQTSTTLQAISTLSLKGGSETVGPMFAAAVPSALDKPLLQLLNELEGEYRNINGED